jgi:hypothetical protein
MMLASIKFDRKFSNKARKYSQRVYWTYRTPYHRKTLQVSCLRNMQKLQQNNIGKRNTSAGFAKRTNELLGFAQHLLFLLTVTIRYQNM